MLCLYGIIMRCPMVTFDFNKCKDKKYKNINKCKNKNVKMLFEILEPDCMNALSISWAPVRFTTDVMVSSQHPLCR